MTWKVIERPGYLGKHREKKYQEWDATYGEANWRLVWLWEHSTLGFVGACRLYEDAYKTFLEQRKDILHELITTAFDVYDDSPTNVRSGTDYKKQETGRTHIQDIAIRRALKRLKTEFKGKELIQIRHDRGIHPLSMILSPGKVPFHKPHLITKPWLEGWWDAGTVECFYQSNRVLQVRR